MLAPITALTAEKAAKVPPSFEEISLPNSISPKLPIYHRQWESGWPFGAILRMCQEDSAFWPAAHAKFWRVGSDRSKMIPAIFKRSLSPEERTAQILIAGVLEGILDLALTYLKERSVFDKPLAEYQYMQQKVIDIYQTHVLLWGIIHQVVDSKPGIEAQDLSQFENELAVLKIAAMDDGLRAATSFFEVFGYRSYMRDSLPAKLLQDILAFKFLGGSKEKQKVLLFQGLSARTNLLR